MPPSARLVALVIAGALCGMARAERSRALVVVVAKASKVKSLSKAELRRCFSGDAVVVNDVRLIPFNFAPGLPERLAFDRGVLGLSPEEVGRYWVDRKIRGERQAPRALPGAPTILRIVVHFPGAIGYVPADQVTDDVAVVQIEGLALTAVDAPLR